MFENRALNCQDAQAELTVVTHPLPKHPLGQQRRLNLVSQEPYLIFLLLNSCLRYANISSVWKYQESNFKVFCSKILLRDHFLCTWKKKYSDFCKLFSIYWSEFEITDISISLRRIVVGLQPFFPLKYLKQAQKYFYVETITFHFFVSYLARKEMTKNTVWKETDPKEPTATLCQQALLPQIHPTADWNHLGKITDHIDYFLLIIS